jgi:hypothetical protein
MENEHEEAEHVEHSEAAAAEALADVAVVAIEATAERVEALTEARVEAASAADEVLRLERELADHKERNVLDFLAVRDELQRAHERLGFLEDALAAAERELAEVEKEEVPDIVVAEVPAVADVAAAEAEDPVIAPPAEHHDRPAHGKRAFIRI